MKARILSLIVAAAACSSYVSAQTETMNVTLTDGTTTEYLVSDIESITFEGTTSAEFTVEVSNVTSTSASLKITPADPSIRYYFDCALLSDFEQHGAAYIVETYFESVQRQYPTLTMEQIMSFALSVGPDADEVSGLPSDTDMVCYAIEVNNEGKCVGKGSFTKFHTLKGGDPKDCTFEIGYDNMTTTSLDVIVNPSDLSVRYWMGIYSAVEWPGDVAMPILVKSTLDEYAEENGVDISDVVKGVTFKGNLNMNESGLQPETAYYIYVYAMDETGNAAGDLFKQRFVTRDQDYSDAEVSMKYRYFDGDQLQAAYPDKFSNANGRAILQTSFTPGETAENYVWAIAKGDLTDDNIYPEESTKNAVIQGGYHNVGSKNLYVDWGEATIIYFAADAYGIDGPLHRVLINVNKDGVSPVSEYSDPVATETAASAISVAASAPARPKIVLHRGITEDTQTFREIK